MINAVITWILFVAAIDHLSFAVAEMAELVDALAEKLWWLYSYVEQELTWRALCVYGIILLLSWLVTKLFIFPIISPLRKVSIMFVCLSACLSVSVSVCMPVCQ